MKFFNSEKDHFFYENVHFEIFYQKYKKSLKLLTSISTFNLGSACIFLTISLKNDSTAWHMSVTSSVGLLYK